MSKRKIKKKSIFNRKKRENHMRIDADYQNRMSKESKLFTSVFDYSIISKRMPLKELMTRMERHLIVNTLNKVDGNRRMAAEILGIKYTTLHEKIKIYDIRLKGEYI
jgi:DNA-binding NtrC family response regulator